MATSRPATPNRLPQLLRGRHSTWDRCIISTLKRYAPVNLVRLILIQQWIRIALSIPCGLRQSRDESLQLTEDNTT